MLEFTTRAFSLKRQETECLLMLLQCEVIKQPIHAHMQNNVTPLPSGKTKSCNRVAKSLAPVKHPWLRTSCGQARVMIEWGVLCQRVAASTGGRG